MTLRRNFSWTFVGNVIYAMCQWGMLSVLAKLGSPAMVGQFALAVALTTPVFAFTNLQLRSVQATDARQDFQFVDYLALRCATTLLAVAILVGLILVGAYSDDVLVVLAVMGVGRALDSVGDVYYGRFQQHEQMDIIAKAMIANGLLSVVMMSLGVFCTGSLVVGVGGSTIASLVTLIGVIVLPKSQQLVVYNRDQKRPPQFSRRWSIATMRNLFVLALPMGIVMFLVSLNGNIPRYVLDAFGDEQQVGIFSALAYLLVAGTTVVSALGQSASPRLAKLHAVGNSDAFFKLLNRLVVIGFALGIAGAILALLAGRPLLSLLYTPEYAAHVDVLVLLAVSAGFAFAASFMGYGMTAARKFRVQVPLFTVVCIVSIFLNVLAIPRYGMVGAAWATMGTAMTQLFASWYVVKRAGAEVGAQSGE